MKQTFMTLVRAKYHKYQMRVRIFYLKKLCGLNIGKNVKLCNIQCEWPSSVTIGNNCDIQQNVLFRIWRPFSSDNYIKIGDGVFIGNDCEFNIASNIIIGDNCLIASRNIFVDGGHEIIPSKLINEQGITIGKIWIGNDVWIGTNCKILKGISIGNGSVIGAGSVVNKSIPPYEIWA
jgi:acetyltransferase-like isoleucine patch superfamily enzyme